MTLIFDASAMIAYVRDEPGAEVVRQLLRDTANTCYAHAVNLCEVYYGFARALGEADALNLIQGLYAVRIVAREDMDQPFWQDVGHLKTRTRTSLADCFGIALARRLGGDLVTSDHHEMDPILPLGLCSVRFIR
jgi:predicted nucleic acid-binding protein